MSKTRHDRLLVALIAKLPAAATHWPCADRIAWLQMMALAFDVVYGPSDPVQVAHEKAHGGQAVKAPASPRHVPAELAPLDTPQRFYVDRDGFAMGDGSPITMDDLPAGAILWDERSGVECGDVAAILWRDIGTTRRSLPLGVTLKPVSGAS